jgi:hypothetical protein
VAKLYDLSKRVGKDQCIQWRAVRIGLTAPAEVLDYIIFDFLAESVRGGLVFRFRSALD